MTLSEILAANPISSTDIVDGSTGVVFILKPEDD